MRALNCNSRGRGEALISADMVYEATSPEIHLPWGPWALKEDEQLLPYPS